MMDVGETAHVLASLPPRRHARTIIDSAGLPVDVSGRRWRLNSPTSPYAVNWDLIDLNCAEIQEATEAYIRALVQSASAAEVRLNFAALQQLAACPAFREATERGDDVPQNAISEFKLRIGPDRGYRLHYIRKWYTWCVDQGYDRFSPEVAFALAEMVVGGNAKGRAVLSADPEEGPLSDLEVVALLNALRAAGTAEAMPLNERAVAWLFVALGSNPKQIALLREEDLERLCSEADDDVGYLLRVPRIKKGFSDRAEFKSRKLTREIGDMLVALIAENALLRERAGVADDEFGKALFRRVAPQESIKNGPMREWALHMSAQQIALLLARAVERLRITSPRTGSLLKVTPRRLRYTFATRLVREGASQRAVAEALDHTDFQNVRVYFDIKSDIVEKLDRAMAMALGPLSQAFLGHLVRAERDAVRGDRPTSRIYRASISERALNPVGTCSSFSFCGLIAPTACYTCVKFQPWMDAPHDKVLEDLLADRLRRQAEGLDERMVGVHDQTILAVADVIRRIELAQTGREESRDH
jgi:integrase